MKALARRELAVDHAGFVTRDLEALVGLFEALGFTVTAPAELEGPAGRLGQRSAHVVLDRGYLELTAPTGEAPDNHLYPLLAQREGVRILVLGCADAGRALQHLDRRLLAHAQVQEAERDIDYGAGGRARFRWFALDAAAFPEALVACAEHLTPERVFDPAVTRHANGTRALAAALIALPAGAEPNPAYGALAAAMGPPAAHVSAASAIEWVAVEALGLADPPREPFVAGVELRVDSLAALAGRLPRIPLRVLEQSAEAITLASDALHCVLRFRPLAAPPSQRD